MRGLLDLARALEDAITARREAEWDSERVKARLRQRDADAAAATLIAAVRALAKEPTA